ncbi:hypothetical protein PISMIDRAFT_364744, partial [Pisolithus microcarpus 441]
LHEHELLGWIITRLGTKCCSKSPLFPACHTLEVVVILDRMAGTCSRYWHQWLRRLQARN